MYQRKGLSWLVNLYEQVPGSDSSLIIGSPNQAIDYNRGLMVFWQMRWVWARQCSLFPSSPI